MIQSTETDDSAAPCRAPNWGELVREYADLERAVSQRMARLCAATCSACASPCCQEAICAESKDSPWLRRVRKKDGENPKRYGEDGWLGKRGCRLATGRPPICYEFYCSALLNAFATGLEQYSAQVLGKLISHAGRRARGDRHLVELDEAALEAANRGRLARNLTEARDALAAVDPYITAYLVQRDHARGSASTSASVPAETNTPPAAPKASSATSAATSAAKAPGGSGSSLADESPIPSAAWSAMTRVMRPPAPLVVAVAARLR